MAENEKTKNYEWNSWTFLKDIRRMREEDGMSEQQIAETMGMTVIQLRKAKSAAQAAGWRVYEKWIDYLKKEGKSIREIAIIIGKAESSVRLHSKNDDDSSESAEEA